MQSEDDYANPKDTTGFYEHELRKDHWKNKTHAYHGEEYEN
jgi:hypothetical protein